MKFKLSKVQRVVEVVEGEGRVMGEEELKKIFNEVRPDNPEVPYYMNKDPCRK